MRNARMFLQDSHAEKLFSFKHDEPHLPSRLPAIAPVGEKEVMLAGDA
jgi:hypothetical protein